MLLICRVDTYNAQKANFMSIRATKMPYLPENVAVLTRGMHRMVILCQHGFLGAGASPVKGPGNDVRRYGGVSNWKGLPANVSFSP